MEETSMWKVGYIGIKNREICALIHQKFGEKLNYRAYFLKIILVIP
jgi:hypothetical protein